MKNKLLIQNLSGIFVNLREVKLDDAEFILKLRTSGRAQFLNKTQDNITLQYEYIKNYFSKKNEIYFIIENKFNKKLGTIRISSINLHDKTFEEASWIMSADSWFKESIEGEYIAKNYAYNILNLEKNLFEVRKKNRSVINFHKMYGSKIIREDNLNVYLELTKQSFNENKNKILKIIHGK